MSKENKFRPNAGYILSVHHNVAGIRAVASALDIFPETLANAMEKTGWQLILDPFDLSADAAKVIVVQERDKNKGLQVVQDPVQEDKPNE